MKRTLYFAGLVMGVLLLAAAPVLAAVQPQTADALVWLQRAQEADGGFSNGFSAGSDYGTTVEVILAVAAAGQDVSRWKSSAGLSPLDYVATQAAGGQLSAAGSLAKALLVATATGQDPRNFGGKDLVADLYALQDSATGQYGDSLFAHAYVVLALHNAGQPVPHTAITLMTSQFTEDGAWALFGGKTPGTADTNTTALVMQALVAVGERDAAAGTLPYLHRMQNEDGGFPYQKPSNWGTETDANSTAVVLQALYALDASMGDWSGSGTDPLGALMALWDADSGAFYWQASVPYANMLATAQAIQAVEGMSLVHLSTVGAVNSPTIQFEAPIPLLPQSGKLLPGLGFGLLGVAMILTGGAILRRK